MDSRLKEKNPQAGTLAQRKGESRPSRNLLEGSPIVSEGGTNSLAGRQTTVDLRQESHEREKELQENLERLREVDAPLAVVDGNKSRGGSSPHMDIPLAVANGNKSRGGSGPGDNLSDQDSRGTSNSWRKRPRSKDSGSLGLSSSEENLSAPKVSTGRRGRGRAVAGVATARLLERDVRGRFVRPDTPAPAECVESDPGHMSADQSGDSNASLLGRNKAEANAAKRAQRQAVAADEVSELARQARERRLARTAAGGDISAVALNRQVMDGLEVVLKVATKSGNLKGTFTYALKQAVSDIQEAVEVLSSRTTTDETAKLWEENRRLRSELEDLKRQFAAQKAASTVTSPSPVTSLAPSSAPYSAPSSAPALADADIERIARICMMQCGQMVSARMEAIEARLPPAETIRPPLAADKRRQEGPAKPTAATAKSRSAGKGATMLTEGPSKPAEGRSVPTSQSAAATPPTPTGPLTEAWTTVVKRGRRRKKRTAPPPATAGAPVPNKAAGPPKVRAPRSAAVVITLQPGAVERGISYKAVLTEARAKVAFPDLGTPSGFKMRPAITGARLLEVSGASSAEKADILAAKLREVLNPEDVRVSRPMKTSELRVDGLDDSATPAEVVAAIARAGGCPSEDVRTGEIRADATGLGMIWVRCPVAAAQKVANGGRLLVGWVAARVKLLQPRELRCYRCLDIGHVRARCTAETDRSEQCYRCGQPGHKAAQCSAAPNCSLCTAAGRPAGHRAGGKACGAPMQQQKRRRRAKVAEGSLPPRQPGCPTADSRSRNRVEGMDCA